MSATRPDVRGDQRDRSRHWLAAAVCATAAALVLAVAPPASAHGGAGGSKDPQQLADGLAGPLSIDLTGRGDVLVSQQFAGTISSVSRRGEVTDLVTGEGVNAVGAGPFGTVVYTVTGEDGSSLLKVRLPWGATKVVADLGAHEATRNPDAGQTYGIPGLAEECAAQWPAEELGPPSYTGIVESNPFAIAVTPWGTYVADSAANAILFADWHGRVRTVSVLPPQPLRIPDDPTPLGLPACAGGLTYLFEPVPTGVELSWAGAFVTLLPGGPEDPSLGARGSVVKLDLRSGRTRPVATGILGATDLAVSPWGAIYVTELFGNRVVTPSRSGLRTVAELNEPVAIEWGRGGLVVAHDAFGSGKISVIKG